MFEIDISAANDGEWFEEYGYIDIDPAATEDECMSRNDGLTRKWARADYSQENPECLVLASAPDCRQVGWTRVNHLGNGRDGVPLNYTWRLPYFPSGNNKLAVLRIRCADVYRVVILLGKESYPLPLQSEICLSVCLLVLIYLAF